MSYNISKTQINSSLHITYLLWPLKSFSLILVPAKSNPPPLTANAGDTVPNNIVAAANVDVIDLCNALEGTSSFDVSDFIAESCEYLSTPPTTLLVVEGVTNAFVHWIESTAAVDTIVGRKDLMIEVVY